MTKRTPLIWSHDDPDEYEGYAVAGALGLTYRVDPVFGAVYRAQITGGCKEITIHEGSRRDCLAACDAHHEIMHGVELAGGRMTLAALSARADARREAAE